MSSSLAMSRCVPVLLLLVHLARLGSAQPVDGLAELKNMKAVVEELQAERRGKLLSTHKSCLHTANGNVSNFSYDKTNVCACYSITVILFHTPLC